MCRDSVQIPVTKREISVRASFWSWILFDAITKYKYEQEQIKAKTLYFFIHVSFLFIALIGITD